MAADASCHTLSGARLFFRLTPSGGTAYVATNGSAGAAGTIDDPLDLLTASRIAQPGWTYKIRGGTYTLDVTLARSGLSGYPITFEPYVDEAVTLDGALVISGDYVNWTGTRHTDSTFTDRDATPTGGKVGVDILGNHVTLKRCIIRNFKQGVTSSDSVSDVTLRGNLIYYCGWDSSLGHNIYIQNADPWKYFYANILHSAFAFNFHLWGSSGDVSNMHVEGNTAFNAGVLSSSAGFYTNILNGCQSPFSNPKIIRNYCYFSSAKSSGSHYQIGYGVSNTVTNALIQDNVCGGGQDGNPNDSVSLGLLTCIPTALDGNVLYGEINGWNLTTWPDNTQGNTASAKPDSVHLEEIETGYATLTIYNMQAQANTVNVDVSALFGQSGTVKAYNAQDPLVDIQTLTLTAGVITVNMEAINRTVETPVGWAAPVTTFPAFGCFILIK